MRRLLLALVVTGSITAGCQPPRVRPPTGCEEPDARCGFISPPIGPGPGRRDGGGLGDAGASDAATNVTGTVLLAQGIPLPAGAMPTRSAIGWTVDSLVSPAAGPLTTTTDATGRFSLEGVPVIDDVFVLRASPGMGALGAVLEARPTAATLPVYAVEDSVLVAAGANASVTVNRALAHIVMQVGDPAATRAGVQGVLVGSSANVAYDDVGGLLTASSDRTGPMGYIVFFNVAAPAAGRFVEVQISRPTAGSPDAGAVLVYETYVLPGHVSWFTVAQP